MFYETKFHFLKQNIVSKKNYRFLTKFMNPCLRLKATREVLPPDCRGTGVRPLCQCDAVLLGVRLHNTRLI